MIVLKWIGTMILAVVIQRALDAVLPADTSRLMVIVAGGIAGMLWSRLDDLIMGRSRR